jgi:hypothetical protein
MLMGERNTNRLGTEYKVTGRFTVRPLFFSGKVHWVGGLRAAWTLWRRKKTLNPLDYSEVQPID